MKRYRAVITLVALLFCGTASGWAIDSHDLSTQSRKSVGSVNNLSLADDNFALVNELRASLGLTPLRRNSTLDEAARLRAQELEEYYSHTRPNGTEPFTAMEEAGYDYTSAAENIAMAQGYDDSTMGEKFFDMWRNSAGHYANMTTRDCEEIGIGLFKTSDGTWYAVQLFGTGTSSGGNNYGYEQEEEEYQPRGGDERNSDIPVVTIPGMGGSSGKDNEPKRPNNQYAEEEVVVSRPDRVYRPGPSNNNDRDVISNPQSGGGSNEYDENFALVNQLRRSVGVAELRRNSKLDRAAQLRAQELVQYYSHTRPDGTDPFTSMTQMGYSHGWAAENIAMASGYDDDTVGELFFEMWRESSGHYRNMIGVNYQEIGIGLYKSGDTWYAVQLFASPM